MEHLCFLSSDALWAPLRSLSSALCTLDSLAFNPVCAQLCLTFVAPRTTALQAPLSLEFSRQECWSRLPIPTPWDPPSPGIQFTSLCIGRRILYHFATWETLTQLKTWLDFGNWGPLPIYFDNILEISYFDTNMHLESPLHFISYIHRLISPGGIINSVGWVRKWGLGEEWWNSCRSVVSNSWKSPSMAGAKPTDCVHEQGLGSSSAKGSCPDAGTAPGPWSPSSRISSQTASVFLYSLPLHGACFSST